MNLSRRIELLCRLGEHMLSTATEWKETMSRASRENPWFIPDFTELAVKNIANNFLDQTTLEKWVAD